MTSLSMRLPQALSRSVQLIRRHPDVAWVALLILIASLIRLAFLYRAPVFIRPDSVAYFQAGYELARGLGGDIPIRRTAGYPLFLALVIWLFGEELHSIALIQHGLGVATVVMTYFIGKRLFGRLAGGVAGLLLGISGPTLIIEHYLMAEPVFTFLLAAAFLLLLRGLQQRTLTPLALSGCCVALAYLARPVGGAVVPVFLLGTLLAAGVWKQRLLRSALVMLGFMSILGPSMLMSRLAGGEATPALGQTLYGRIVRHDERIVYPSPTSPAPYTDPQRVAARQMILQAASRDLRPSAINHRLQNALGLTPVEADRALREVVIETLQNQPERYVQGSFNKARAILLGEVERLGFHWNSRVDRDLRETWQSNASIAHALLPISVTQRNEQPTTEAILRIFQPAQHRTLLMALMVLALVGAALRREHRLALLIPLFVLALIIPAALLVGQVPRYRYPVDPLMAVLVGGGVALLVRAVVGGARRARLLGFSERSSRDRPALGDATPTT